MNFADKYALTADLPGYRKEDIDISAEGHFITIAVQTESVIENPDQQPDDASGAGEFIMHERNHSTYTRIIELPRPIDLDTLRGTYIDGVVRIEVLKQAVENHETVHISL
ncbi:MAG: hypothetical protein COB04_15870 [Gammaproteobacteria bacterium]|nr:MAG: hypothetical protein COB04_15870 [Gammaproteobacteria bacterium]